MAANRYQLPVCILSLLHSMITALDGRTEHQAQAGRAGC